MLKSRRIKNHWVILLGLCSIQLFLSGCNKKEEPAEETRQTEWKHNHEEYPYGMPIHGDEMQQMTQSSASVAFLNSHLTGTGALPNEICLNSDKIQGLRIHLNYKDSDSNQVRRAKFAVRVKRESLQDKTLEGILCKSFDLGTLLQKSRCVAKGKHSLCTVNGKIKLPKEEQVEHWQIQTL